MKGKSFNQADQGQQDEEKICIYNNYDIIGLLF
jgi:hypothetical protein